MWCNFDRASERQTPDCAEEEEEEQEDGSEEEIRAVDAAMFFEVSVLHGDDVC